MESSLTSRDRVGVSDLVLLEDFRSQDVVIDNLRKRFKEGHIYTYIGPVVVSVNPYKELDIYTEDVIQQYHNVNYFELPAHVYALAAVTYRCMRAEHRDQCVLISGESGAGKTEASKKILQYVAGVSRHTHEVDRVRDRLLLSNPVLEAFGNAKTNRNDNSSRFGKYMDVQFSFTGAPAGGHVLEYLLEKARVVHQAAGERNFHIFYQLLAGAEPDLLARLQLTSDPGAYHYLSQGGSSRVRGMDDRVDFREVRRAMTTCEFSSDEIESLLAVVAGILHLGNLTFEESEDGYAGIAGAPDTCAQLFACEPESLARALTHRSIEAQGQILSSPLSVEQALFVKDSLAKGVYDRLFHWIVSKINASLSCKDGERKTLMGLLDIYGFEVFELNSFEQFCINFCNEKLQQLFIRLTLKSEQEEYLNEGIEWESVDFFNNKVICDLIEAKPYGIIAIMDEECLRPGNPTDASLLTKLSSMAGSHDHLKLPTTGVRGVARDEFHLVHYAGEVRYNVNGFLDKNNDLFFRDLKEAMSGSSNPVLQSCFPRDEVAGKKRPQTAGTQFKTSLNGLMEILMLKEPSYVRCIKPNQNKSAGEFDETLVEHQVKYLGLMENLRVRRAGYAYRREYDIFLNRYKPLCEETWPLFHGPAKDGVDLLMCALSISRDQYKMGRTKVFVRSPRTLFDIEDAFQEKKHVIATIIQTRYRGFAQKKKYQLMRSAVTMISKCFKRWKAQALLKRRRWAATLIRSFVKGFMLRHEPPCGENALFVRLTRMSFCMHLSRHLPRSVLDKAWPDVPPICNQASEQLRALYYRQLVRIYRSKLTPQRQTQLEEKVVAERVFQDRKVTYRPSIAQPFLDNRLGPDQSGLQAFEAKHKSPGEQLKYVCGVTKYDRRGFKKRSRLAVITSGALYTLSQPELKLKDRVLFDQITGVELSPLSDSFVIVHVMSSPENGGGNSELKGDLVLVVTHPEEFVTKLVRAHPGLEANVTFCSGPIQFQGVKGKACFVDINKGDVDMEKVKNDTLQVSVRSV